MFFLGAGERAALHNPDYDFPDDLIPIGSRVFMASRATCWAENQPASTDRACRPDRRASAERRRRRTSFRRLRYCARRRLASAELPRAIG